MHARTYETPHPIIIQGGMGAGVSGWQLARAVSQAGQLGVVSGTGLDLILARRLQFGDPGKHLRRAMAAFPFPAMVDRILDRYLIEGGKALEEPFVSCPMGSAEPSQSHIDLLLVSNFIEVYLAKEGHDGLVGINYLEKIQLPTLPSVFGAMLAGVDYVLMGAGIPRSIPGILDALVAGEPVELSLTVEGNSDDSRHVTRFDPSEFVDCIEADLKRPQFLAIVASVPLAAMLARKATGHVDGFVVEGATAGGHNAPPRGAPRLNESGEPIYGERDEVDLAAIAALGRPFWLAGSYGDPARVTEALAAGAAGVQVGTAFAYCEESGLTPDIKRRVLDMAKRGQTKVLTDPVASPTGFPFKVVQLPGSISESDAYQQRQRDCDLGYLRHAYQRQDGTLGWRCPSEPADRYVQKGGREADTCGRKCVCNGLLAAIGLGQIRRDGTVELPLVTSGDDVRGVVQFLPTHNARTYRARDVIERLLTGAVARVPATLPNLSKAGLAEP